MNNYFENDVCQNYTEMQNDNAIEKSFSDCLN